THKCAQTRQEAGRPERPPGGAEHLTKADLRHEAVVRAETVAEILVLREPVRVRPVVAPLYERPVPAERLSGPLVREVGPLRRPRVAQQKLAIDRVATGGPPFEVWTGNAIAAVAIVILAFRQHRPHEREPD